MIESLSRNLNGDARHWQIAALGTLVFYSFVFLDFGAKPLFTAIALSSVLATQWVCSKLWRRPFEWRSGLITGLSLSLLLRTKSFPLSPVLSASAKSSAGVLRECFPLPPAIYMPRSLNRGFNVFFNAPITDVVIPDECQSMPSTQPNAWNQNGSLIRCSTASLP